MSTPTPLILSENFYNTAQFPSHAITVDEEAVTDSKYWPGRGQRSPIRYLTATTANSDWWHKVTCDRIRAANCLFHDRGHNLAGKSHRLDVSNDDFTTYESPISSTMPSVSGPGHIDDALGVRTEEAAWGQRFPVRAGKYWRTFVPAVASFRPQLVGVYLGLAWSPPVFDWRWAEDDDELGGATYETDRGWVGSAGPWNRRSGTLRIRLASDADYDMARLMFHGFFRRRSPMWLIHDINQAERAVLAIRPNGVMGWGYERNWLNKRQAEIPWVELEPDT